MAEDVGGIGVRFTAEAAQLEAEIKRLDERLRGFDRAHGTQTVKLQTQLTMPGQRQVLDLRRDITKQVASAGSVRAQIMLQAPVAHELAKFSSSLQDQIKPIKVKVTGNFEWGERPPSSVNVRVVGGGGGGAGGAAAGGGGTRPPERAAASGRVLRPSAAERNVAPTVSDIHGLPPAIRRTRTQAPAITRVTAADKAATWTKDDLLPFSDSALADEMRHAKGADKALMQQELDRRQIAALRRSGGSGGARGYLGSGPQPFVTAATSGSVPHYTATSTMAVHAATVGGMGRRGELTQPARDLYDPYGASVKRPNATVAGMEKAGLTVDVLAQNLRKVLDRAVPQAVQMGLRWYGSAGKLAEGISSGVSRPRENRVRAASVFSTQASWEENVRNAQDFFDVVRGGATSLKEVEKGLRAVRGGKYPSTRGVIAKAWGTLQADDPEAFLAGPKGQSNPKLRNFGGNLLGDYSLNTADRHDAMIMTGGRFSTPKDKRASDMLQRATQTVAKERGWSVAQTQAVAWATALGHEIAGPDPHGQMARGRPQAARGLPQAAMQRMHGAIQSDWGGFSYDPRTGGWVEKEKGRASGPYLSGVGKTTRLTTEQARDPKVVEAAVLRVMRENAKLLAKPGHVIGGFQSPDRGEVDLDVSKVDQTMAAALATQRRRGKGARGAYDVATGQGVFAANNVYGNPATQRPQGASFTGQQRAGPAYLTGTPRGLSPEERWDDFGLTQAGHLEGYGTARYQEDLARSGLPSPGRRMAGLSRAQQGVRVPGGMGLPHAGTFATQEQLDRMIESRAGVGAPGAPNRPVTPQAAQAAVATEAAGQSMIKVVDMTEDHIKALGAAAQATVKMIQAHPHEAGRMEESFRASPGGPEIFQEIDTARRAAAKGDIAGQPSMTERLRKLGVKGESPESLRQEQVLEESRMFRTQAAGVGRVRAVGTTAAGIIANTLGGTGKVTEISRQIAQLEGVYARVGRAGATFYEAEDAAQTEFDQVMRTKNAAPEEIERVTKAYDEAKVKSKDYRKEQAGLEDQMLKLRGKLNTPAIALKGIASSLSGSILGGFAFSAAISGISALAGAFEKPIDAMAGYTGAANKMQSALGDSTRQMHGHAEIALAAAAAQSGLGKATFDAIAPALEQRAVVDAGNKAFGEQVDLIRSSMLFQQQTRAAARGQAYGFGITPGAIPGITGSTGGILGTGFGGQTPMVEQLAQLTPGGTAGQRAGNAAVGAGAGLLGGAAVGAGIGLAFGGIGAIPGALIGGAVGAFGGGAAGAAGVGPFAGLSDINLKPSDFGAPGGARPAQPSRFQFRDARPSALGGGEQSLLTEKQRDQLTSLKQGIGDIAEAAGRASPQLNEQVKATLLIGKSADDWGAKAEKAIDGTAATLKKLGVAQDEVDNLRAARFALTDKRGIALGADAAKSFLQTAQRGFTIPTRESAVAQSIVPIRQALLTQQWQGQMQRGTMIPGQAYLRGLASGRLGAPAGAGSFFPRGVGPVQQRESGIQNLPPEIARSASNYDQGTSTLKGLQSQMASTAQTGRTALISMLQSADASLTATTGSASNLTGEFTHLEKSIGANGKAMRGLQINDMWAEANLQVAQYDEQIRVTSRSLADAQSFVSGAGSGQLGILQHQARVYERQNAAIGFQQQHLSIESQLLGQQNAQLSIRSRELGFQSTQLQFQSRELGMQSTALSLMQNQRQINFQTAVAGFTTPGESPQEMAARQQEAKLQAAYAQKQQDIAVKQFGIEQTSFGLDKQQLPIAQAQLVIDQQQVALQGQQVSLAQQALGISEAAYGVQQAIVDVQAARAIEDLSHQLDLLSQARSVTLMVAVDQEAITALQDQISVDMDTIQSILQTAYGTQSTITEQSLALVAQYGSKLSEWNNALLTGLSDYLEGARNILSGWSAAIAPRYQAPGPSGGDQTAGSHAPGFIGSISSATQMTVGEAGTETVAVLRNPRTMTMQPQSGGGGVTIQVTVTGNNIGGSQQDAETLATIIARKVEEKMARRNSLLGMRAN